MLITRYAAVAALCAGLSPAAGQVVEVVPSEEVVVLGEDGTATVTVSIFLDRQGGTDGFLSTFSGWKFSDGYLGATNGAQWLAPVETETDTITDDWRGRRPPSDLSFGPYDNGSFRYPGVIEYAENSGVDFLAGLTDGAGTPADVERFDSILGRVLTTGPKAGQYGQIGSYQGDFFPDRSDRIEIFRADLLLTTAGTTIAEYFYQTAGEGFAGSLITETDARSRSVPVTFVAATITVVPAPGTLVLIAPVLITRRRR